MTNPLPPYSGAYPRCTKCGNEQADTKYCPAQVWHEVGTGRIIKEEAPEYLERTCTNCGYTWNEKTLEQSKAAKNNPEGELSVQTVHENFINHLTNCDPELAEGLALDHDKK